MGRLIFKNVIRKALQAHAYLICNKSSPMGMDIQ
jgi:hypothetical protein